MTAADIASPAPARRPALPLALSIALRELRAGAGGLVIFVICIALGVTAVASIGSLGASFDEALARQGRLLVGGDLSFERVHRRASAEERAALDNEGQVTESASLRAMARIAGGKSALDRGEGRRWRLSALWRGRGHRAERRRALLGGSRA